MAELVTIARPYAEAVFSLAKESGQLQKWSEMLTLMAGIHADAAMQAALTDEVSSDAEGRPAMLKTACSWRRWTVPGFPAELTLRRNAA